MKIDPASGLVRGVQFVASPNHDARPDGAPVDILVIHSISLPPGKFGGRGVEQLFCNCLDPDEHPYYREIRDLTVSAHFLIRRNGEIIQFVPLHRRAWHAGQSYCEGRTRINDFSIGIELEGTDDMPFEKAQYESLGRLTKIIRRRYPAITPEHVYGHGDIAPGRKTDPGPMFDWQRYLKSLA
ncbi:N-acetyl-anhydromuranmyl-L-alanine amidase [Sulfuricaulis limicola]|uniref:1,6-anhydro-N-acetylmuramyl-L-alanine amidase AmpD n=1 Tax=Sulfuricaulis limicola TaxID=1620215 RepID=A0A1B4XEU3_9GAMM|nr:1,6-anhydro-N-acetylmuramyl-L-alanine amidase AmpD [Sulfuricaulis limicola]BAV33316.1 N-acetyl-anhydromuranmyl-L-alanine amidase [Sulfuricaulis limicola]